MSLIGVFVSEPMACRENINTPSGVLSLKLYKLCVCVCVFVCVWVHNKVNVKRDNEFDKQQGGEIMEVSDVGNARCGGLNMLVHGK